MAIINISKGLIHNEMEKEINHLRFAINFLPLSNAHYYICTF
jgi:hypothetical protein